MGEIRWPSEQVCPSLLMHRKSWPKLPWARQLSKTLTPLPHKTGAEALSHFGKSPGDRIHWLVDSTAGLPPPGIS